MVFDVAKGYRKTEPAAWLCCWSAEPVVSWLAGSSGLKRFSPLLLGLTPDLGTTAKVMSNIRSGETLLLGTRQIIENLDLLMLLNECFACCAKQSNQREEGWVGCHSYLFEFLRWQLIQALQLAQTLSVTLVETEEIWSAVFQKVQDQTESGDRGVRHCRQSRWQL